MSKNGKTKIAGRLYYTFGTIMLLAIIIVCSINFAKDGRAFQKPLLKAAAETANKSEAGSGYKTFKYEKKPSQTDDSSKKTKTTPAPSKAASTPTPEPTQNPGNVP